RCGSARAGVAGRRNGLIAAGDGGLFIVWPGQLQIVHGSEIAVLTASGQTATLATVPGPIRLAAQDAALSRLKHGFESRMGHTQIVHPVQGWTIFDSLISPLSSRPSGSRFSQIMNALCGVDG